MCVFYLQLTPPYRLVLAFFPPPSVPAGASFRVRLHEKGFPAGHYITGYGGGRATGNSGQQKGASALASARARRWQRFLLGSDLLQRFSGELLGGFGFHGRPLAGGREALSFTI